MIALIICVLLLAMLAIVSTAIYCIAEHDISSDDEDDDCHEHWPD